MFAILFWAIVGAAPTLAQPGHWDPRITDVRGAVQVYPAGNAQPLRAGKGLPLQNGDRIATAVGAACEIALGPGDVIRLSGESDFTLQNMGDEHPELWLSLGGMLSKLRRKIEGDGLRIRTTTAVLAVRGTEFGVDAPRRGENSTYIGVFDEGSVEVRGAVGPAQRLSPRQETSVAQGQASKPPSKLERFLRRREAMAAVRARSAYVEAHWQDLPAQERERHRQAFSRDLAPRNLECIRIFNPHSPAPPCEGTSFQGTLMERQRQMEHFEKARMDPIGFQEQEDAYHKRQQEIYKQQNP